MFEKFILQVIVFLMCLIPTWIFLILKAILSPIGFVQIFLVYGLGLYLFGAIQLVLLAVLIAISIEIWTS
jgi:hypothetical protein